MEQSLPEKLKRYKVLKKFPAFFGTRRFITAFTRDRHLSLSWARLVQSMPPPPHPTSRRSILILSCHLRLEQITLPDTKGFSSYGQKKTGLSSVSNMCGVRTSKLQYRFGKGFPTSGIQDKSPFKRAITSGLVRELREHVTNLEMMFRGMSGVEFTKLVLKVRKQMICSFL